MAKMLTMQFPLLNMPSELVLEVASQLPLGTLLKLLRTSKSMKSLLAVHVRTRIQSHLDTNAYDAFWTCLSLSSNETEAASRWLAISRAYDVPRILSGPKDNRGPGIRKRYKNALGTSRVEKTWTLQFWVHETLLLGKTLTIKSDVPWTTMAFAKRLISEHWFINMPGLTYHFQLHTETGEVIAWAISAGDRKFTLTLKGRDLSNAKSSFWRRLCRFLGLRW